MSELIYKQQAIDAIYNTFSYAYCNNCENNGKDDDSCDECHRKYQNWAASKSTIEEVINALPSAETECTCCEYRVGDLCCYSDVKTDMEAMEEGEESE